MNKVILTSDNYSLTNTEFSYYYWSEYFYFINTYGSYLSGTLDTTKPLDEQIYDGETTWQDYMVDQALNTVANTMALVQAAESEGFALDEEFTASMQSVLENFETYAVSGGFTKADGQADLGAYLQDSSCPRKYGLVPDIPSQPDSLRPIPTICIKSPCFQTSRFRLTMTGRITSRILAFKNWTIPCAMPESSQFNLNRTPSRHGIRPMKSASPS